METKQTAVQFLESRIKLIVPDEKSYKLIFERAFKKAKKMHQLEIMNANLRGIERGIDLTKEKYINPVTLAHKYYDDVYGEKFGEKFGGKDE
jgi:hypothetical protein